MYTPMLPTVVKLAGCPLHGEPLLTHRKLLSAKNLAALQLLTHKPVRLASTIHPLNGTHTSIVSRLQNP